jgi:hypothetical protein
MNQTKQTHPHKAPFSTALKKHKAKGRNRQTNKTIKQTNSETNKHTDELHPQPPSAASSGSLQTNQAKKESKYETNK